MSAVNRQMQLLSDAPADNDAFEGGHDRVAQALSTLIQDEDGGKAIALSGPFGSGKSTVIRLLKGRLEKVDEVEGEDTRIFTFDAWEHQGDPLRRSFIESLVEFLRDEGWAEEKQWKDKIERLARRKEVTTVDTRPKLTGWGRSVAISLFLSPLGLLLLNTFLRTSDGEWQTGSPEVWFWIIGLFLVMLPLMLIAGAWTCGKDPFYVLVKKTHQEEETKTIRTPDPTTIEFQDIFRKIVSTTLGSGRRQLIVVVDNLDRLPPEQALSTWATMRTFFDTGGANGHNWMDRFWLIVPLNFDALRGVFTSSAGKTIETELDADKQSDNESSDSEAVEAFANKTFRTVFRVAPPVLSDWEEFMKDQFAEAFGLDDLSASEQRDFHTVYLLYRISGIDGSGIPTPRDIKTFINRLFSLHRQWGNEISLPMLAAYQLKNDDISENGEELTDPDFLKRRMKTELRGEDWQKQFAALHFNVDQSRAIQVLIGEQVQTALETGNEEESLEELSDTPGFATVVDQTIPRIVESGDPSVMALAALALDTVAIDAEDTKSAAWWRLRTELRNAQNWYPDQKRVGEGVLLIIRHSPENMRKRMASDVLSTVSKVNIDAPLHEEPNEANSWTNGVLPLVRAVKDHTSLLSDNFHVPASWEAYISSMASLSKRQDAASLAPYFVPGGSLEMDGLDETVGEMVSSDAVRGDQLEGIRLMRFVEPISNLEWSATCEAICNRLSWNNDISSEQLRTHLETAVVFAAVHNLHSLQKKLGDNEGRANLSHHLHSNQNADEITALCTLLRLLYSPDQNRGNNFGSANQGDSRFKQILQDPGSHTPIVQEVAQIVSYFDIVWELVQASKKQIAEDFVKQVVEQLVVDSETSRLIDHTVICGFPDVVGEALDDNNLKEVVLQANEGGRVTDHLNAVPRKEWMERLKTESYLLDVVLLLIEEHNLQLTSEFQDALHEHSKWVLDQKTSPSRLLERWDQLLNALSSAGRKSFLRRLQQTLLSRSGPPMQPVLSMYGSALNDSGFIGDVSISDETDTVNNHFRPLVQQGRADELTWLHEVLRGHSELSDRVDPDIWEAFKEVVVETHSNVEGESRTVLKRIGDFINADLENGDEDKSSQSENSEEAD